MLGLKIVQVKGFMMQGSGKAEKPPPAESLGEITFSTIKKFVML